VTTLNRLDSFFTSVSIGIVLIGLAVAGLLIFIAFLISKFNDK